MTDPTALVPSLLRPTPRPSCPRCCDRPHGPRCFLAFGLYGIAALPFRVRPTRGSRERYTAPMSSTKTLKLQPRSTSPHKIYISAQDLLLRTRSTSPHKIHISAQDLHLRTRSTSPHKIHIFVMLVVWNGAKPCGLGTRFVSFELYRSGLRPLLGSCPTCRL